MSTLMRYRMRVEGTPVIMLVSLPASGELKLEERTEEHFGYLFQGEFHYEDNGKYFTQPLTRCTSVCSDSK
jgi:hypothetical protein